MSILNKLTLLATAMGLAFAASQAQANDDDRDSGRGPGSTADFSTAPRVDVHKPAEIIPLYMRDKRIHG